MIVSECDWDKLLESDDVDQCLKIWNECFMNIMGSCIPKGVLATKKEKLAMVNEEPDPCNA